ncbi:MAG: hypothetical protein F6K65_33665 [Moorea sp. SIO3C2]|nr:hypothetical protein [Moorena sp. SIO3C2]
MHQNSQPNSNNNSNGFIVPYILKGSRQQITHTAYILNALGYIQISEWGPLQPTGTPGEYITMMTRYWIWR